MLDKLSPQLRHTVILLVGGALGTVVQELPNYNLPPVVSSLLGVVLAQATLYFTKLTKQYGKK